MNEIDLNILPRYIDEDIEFSSNYYENTDIIRLENIHIKGDVDYNLSDELEINLKVTGKMILSDAITLEEITSPIDLEISEILDKSAKYYKNEQNTLDKLEFLWENIVLEIPISLTRNSGVNLKGEGWELNREEQDEINPELAKLKDIFKGGE
ncbi:MAG: YceD family protein [Bacilli bacterium]